MNQPTTTTLTALLSILLAPDIKHNERALDFIPCWFPNTSETLTDYTSAAALLSATLNRLRPTEPHPCDYDADQLRTVLPLVESSPYDRPITNQHNLADSKEAFIRTPWLYQSYGASADDEVYLYANHDAASELFDGLDSHGRISELEPDSLSLLADTLDEFEDYPIIDAELHCQYEYEEAERIFTDCTLYDNPVTQDTLTNLSTIPYHPIDPYYATAPDQDPHNGATLADKLAKELFTQATQDGYIDYQELKQDDPLLVLSLPTVIDNGDLHSNRTFTPSSTTTEFTTSELLHILSARKQAIRDNA